MLGPKHRIAFSACWIILCTLVSFVVQGQIMEPAANWFQYLPLMAEVHDSSLFPRDDFVPILIEKTPSWFYWALGKMVPTANPYPYLFLLNILTRLASGALIFWIAQGLANDWKAGFIAVFLLSGQVDTVLGRGDINWPYFTHTALSIPLLLLSLGLLLRRRFYAAFAVAGITWNIHLLNAAYYSVFLAFWLGLHRRSLGWKASVRAIGLALLLSLPVLPRILSGLFAQGVDALWMQHALAYHKHLLSPFSQPLEAWVRFAGYLLLFAVFIQRQRAAWLRRTGWAMLAMWITLYLLGYLFTEWSPLPLFLKLQPCRCTDVFLLLFFAWFSKETLDGLSSESLSERTLHWGLLTLLYFFNLRVLASPLKDSLTIVWLILVLARIRLALPSSARAGLEQRRFWAAAIAGSVLYSMAVLTASSSLSLAWMPKALVFLSQRHLLLTSLLFFIAAAYLVTRLPVLRLPSSARRLTWVTLLLLVFLGVEWGQRAGGLAALRHTRRGHFLFVRFDPAFYEAARWCRRRTPPEALFIVPPYRGGFRSESLRSVLVSWDEQLALWIAPEYVGEYDRRLRLLGFEPYPEDAPSTTWHPTLPQILSVRDEFGADYLVIENSKRLPFPIAFQNARYTIYALGGPDLH